MYTMDTRARLIVSTRTLLWERGYVGTSPKAIQHLAEAGQGSMYHHFTGKEDLALAAITETAGELRAAAQAQLSAPAPAMERITSYLRRERDVLRGCAVGGLTQDPDVMASATLRAPIDQTLAWLRSRLADVIREGQVAGDLDAGLDAVAVGTAIVAVMQGGYVLARAAGNSEPFDQAVAGVLALLGARSL